MGILLGALGNDLPLQAAGLPKGPSIAQRLPQWAAK